MGLFGRRKEEKKAPPAAAAPAKAKPTTAPAAPAAPAGMPPKAKSDTVELLRRHKKQISILQQKEEFLKAQMGAEMKKALQLKNSGDKQGAVLQLKKRKLHEQELEKTGNILLKLEQQVVQIEGTANDHSVFEALAQGTEHVQKYQVTAEKADDIMANMQEQYDNQQEISSILAQDVGPLYDQDELLGELEEEEKRGEDEKLMDLLKQGENAVGSSIPTHQPPAAAAAPKRAAKNTEDEELAKLEKEMNLVL